jgi:hypothetical protein
MQTVQRGRRNIAIDINRPLLQVRSAIAERARAAEERELWSAVGFRHVVDLLARAGKPLVLQPMPKIVVWAGGTLWFGQESTCTPWQSADHAITCTSHLLRGVPSSVP